MAALGGPTRGDGSIFSLVQAVLEAPIAEESASRRAIQPNARGTLQAGVIPPRLAPLEFPGVEVGWRRAKGPESRIRRGSPGSKPGKSCGTPSGGSGTTG